MIGVFDTLVRPPPLTPPRKGEGKAVARSSPSPLWGGARGGGRAAAGERAAPP